MIPSTSHRLVRFLNEHRVPIVLSMLWTVVLSIYAWLRHIRLNSSTFDLGIKAQVIWNTWQGDWFASSVEVSHYLGDHVQLIFLLLAPFLGLWADVRILLVLQSLLLSLGAIPVYRISLRYLDDHWLAFIFTLIYLLFPLIGFVNRFDFHPVVFTIPFFLTAHDLLESDRPSWASMFILLALSLREEVGLTVFAFGLYAVFFMNRKRLGLFWAAIGLTWSYVAFFAVIPYFRGGDSDTITRYGWLGDSFLEITGSLLTKPSKVFEHLLVPYRVAVPTKLLLPTAFLSLLSPAPLLVTLPSLAYNLLSETPSQSSIYFQYLAPAVPFIFIASIMGAHRIKVWFSDRKASVIITIWLVLGTYLAWAWDNPFTQEINDPYFPVYGLEQLTDAQSLYSALDMLPPEASVATMMAYGPHLALRPEFSLFYDRLQLPDRPHGFAWSDYLLLNLRDLRWGVNARLFYNAIQIAIGRFGYEAIFFENDVVLLQRDIDSQSLTGTVLARVQELLEAGGKYAPSAQETIEDLGKQWVVENLPQNILTKTAQFDHDLKLIGFESPAEIEPGKPLCVTLYWQAGKLLPSDYTVFLHLVAEDGFVQAQNDSMPVFEYYPTSAWQPDEVIADLHCVVVPPGLRQGAYTLRTGLYDADNGSRMQLMDPVSSDDAFDLVSINLQSAPGES